VSGVALVGWSAGALLVALWLVVSFMAPSRRREIVEWVAATSMYVALLMLFTYLVQDARADQSTVRLVGFGFLWLVFAGGCLVSAVNTLRSLRGAARAPVQGTTH
jgi:hypothetical protein